jgi:hypothetical protein
MRDHPLLWIASLNSRLTHCSIWKSQSTVGWNVHPKDMVAQFLFKIRVLYCIDLFTCVIIVHELCANENDLYATLMNGLVVSHVDY